MELIICGALGHMGMAVAHCARRHDVHIQCGIDRKAGKEDAVGDYPVYPDFDSCHEEADCLIDFSSREALAPLLAFALKRRLPCVLCSTGYTQEDLAAIQEASRLIPVFRSSNMSLGGSLLSLLVEKAASVLDASFDVEIVEAHHRRKKDAPSGTAIMLRDAVNRGRGTVCATRHGREGNGLTRPAGEIGMHALRGGTVTGEHQVYFLGDMERLVLSHTAEDRSVFADGALRASEYLITCQAGMYSMRDLLSSLLN